MIYASHMIYASRMKTGTDIIFIFAPQIYHTCAASISYSFTEYIILLRQYIIDKHLLLRYNFRERRGLEGSPVRVACRRRSPTQGFGSAASRFVGLHFVKTVINCFYSFTRLPHHTGIIRSFRKKGSCFSLNGISLVFKYDEKSDAITNNYKKARKVWEKSPACFLLSINFRTRLSFFTPSIA